MFRILITLILVFFNTAAFAFDIEPQQRAHSPLLSAGLASESEIGKNPYGRRFPAVCSGELQTIIVPPPDPVMAGDIITVEVYFLNSFNHTVTAQLPQSIESRLISGSTISNVHLIQNSLETLHEIIIPPSGFIKKQYTFAVPETLEGSVGMEFVNLSSKRALFSVLKKDEKAGKCLAESPKSNDTLEEIQSLFQSEFPYFPAYEPTYFSVGADPEKSKFQFSFKYRLFDVNKHDWAKNKPWLSGFHFAYTQTSLWDLKSDSKPFDDTSYKPEIFYLTGNIKPAFFAIAMPYLCFKTGFQHESNGKGGTDSRSTNYFYIKPISAFDLGKDYHLEVGPKVWIYAGNDNQTNPDIEDYRGYFDLELKFGKRDSLVFSTNIRYGSQGGSIQTDATYPLCKILLLGEKQDWLNPNIYFHIQYFNGYGESLIRYNEKSHALRMGIALVR